VQHYAAQELWEGHVWVERCASTWFTPALEETRYALNTALQVYNIAHSAVGKAIAQMNCTGNPLHGTAVTLQLRQRSMQQVQQCKKLTLFTARSQARKEALKHKSCAQTACGPPTLVPSVPMPASNVWRLNNTDTTP
jgi:hypothetical protein